MSDNLHHSLRKQEGLGGSLVSGGLAPQISSLIERLPVDCQTELMKGFTGDLLQLAVKVQEIQATNIEAREHLDALATLLSSVKRDGNRGYAKHTSQNAGGQTTIEIGTGGGPILRPVGGGCAIVVGFALTAGTFLTWLMLA